MNEDPKLRREQQFRDIRHAIHTQGVAVLFAGNGAVAAAIVQWLLRDTGGTPALRWCALTAAFVHGVGMIAAASVPLTRLDQHFKDAAAGKIEDPRKAAPLFRLRAAVWAFALGVLLLGLGLFLREWGSYDMNALIGVSYVLTIVGAAGMVFYATAFGFSTNPRVDNPKAYYVWCASWAAIISAAVLQLAFWASQ